METEPFIELAQVIQRKLGRSDDDRRETVDAGDGLRELAPDRGQSFHDDTRVRPFVHQRGDNILNAVDG
jgi:hypothetical protein